MDTASLRHRIERLIRTHSGAYIRDILDSGFSCLRCGWCCRENFTIRITSHLFRPSNAISVFPDDIRRIIKGTGLQWDEIAQPDIYSGLFTGDAVRVIGWILRRNDSGDCVFYMKGECTIYRWRPVICKCYPFFMGERGVDIMQCKGLGRKMTEGRAVRLGRLLKRYEIKKLRSYIGIINQIGDKPDLSSLRSLERDYSGKVLICDGEAISQRYLKVQ